ncbi:glycoside hydrolase family 75 protein [Xylariaceae sp. FL0016]|nr:glycoside hydrolase family 75 protein [Xylariaceae sp. FL0016]
MSPRTIIALTTFLGLSLARDIPSNVQSLYDSIKSVGQCSNKLASGFYALGDGSDTFSYCGDHQDDSNIIYLQGTSGALADMDIDCDGTAGGPADDGRCGNSQDTQSGTSFQDTLAGYGKGVDNLDAKIHPYVVFGNVGSSANWNTFDPQDHGIEPLSLMAVVCGDKLIYGVWGDENGDDGDKPMVGEASISLATACFGTSMTGDNGHTDTDVLYIAFKGKDAVPGADGAKWDAQSYDEFEASIEDLGNSLIKGISTSAAVNGGKKARNLGPAVPRFL